MSRWALALRFEPRDLWIGVFWTTVELEGVTLGSAELGDSVVHVHPRRLHVWICLLPTLPFYFRVPLRARRTRAPERRGRP